jgi:hypothetical protein
MKEDNLTNNNMEKEFIPYTLALDMKSIGFDEPCIMNHYGNDRLHVGRLYLPSSFGKGKNSEMHDDSLRYGDITAILYQQAFRWFREKYNIVHTVYSNASGYMWELHYNTERGGTHICDSAESGDCEMSGMFTTYEKAEIECLKKLIEIVKEK